MCKFVHEETVPVQDFVWEKGASGRSGQSLMRISAPGIANKRQRAGSSGLGRGPDTLPSQRAKRILYTPTAVTKKAFVETVFSKDISDDVSHLNMVLCISKRKILCIRQQLLQVGFHLPSKR